jgi:uncharacterized protein (TIGR00251 family)
MTEWYSQGTDSFTLYLHVQPGAKQTTVAGLHGGALKIRLAAPPVEGKANKVLLKFVAEFFNVPLRNVLLKQGELSRHKRVVISGSKIHPEHLLKLSVASKL